MQQLPVSEHAGGADLRSMRGQPAIGLGGDRRAPASRRPSGEVAAAMVPDHQVLEPIPQRRWTLAAIRRSGWPSDLQTPSVLLRMIVPGWAQRYAGRPTRGKWMFWCYLGLLLPGLLFLGTGLGWLLLGLAISLHAASVLDIVAASVHDFRQRLIYRREPCSYCWSLGVLSRRTAAGPCGDPATVQHGCASV